jgi:hypothetical protein
MSLGEVAKQVLQNRIMSSLNGGGGDSNSGSSSGNRNDAPQPNAPAPTPSARGANGPAELATSVLRGTVNREFERRLGVSLDEVLASLQSRQSERSTGSASFVR